MSSRPLLSSPGASTTYEYRDTPFGRSLGTTPSGRYWSVRGRSRYTRRVATILNYRTKEEAQDAVRELRRDFGDDLSWSNPTGPHFGGGDR